MPRVLRILRVLSCFERGVRSLVYAKRRACFWYMSTNRGRGRGRGRVIRKGNEKDVYTDCIFSQKGYLIKWAWKIFHRGFLVPNFLIFFEKLGTKKLL